MKEITNYNYMSDNDSSTAGVPKEKQRVEIDIEFLEIYYNLSKKAHKIINYIFKNIYPNYNNIILTRKLLVYITDSKHSYEVTKAINELMDAYLIERDSRNKDCYIINHNYFFKGNFNVFVYNYNRLKKQGKL